VSSVTKGRRRTQQHPRMREESRSPVKNDAEREKTAAQEEGRKVKYFPGKKKKG